MEDVAMYKDLVHNKCRKVRRKSPDWGGKYKFDIDLGIKARSEQFNNLKNELWCETMKYVQLLLLLFFR